MFDVRPLEVYGFCYVEILENAGLSLVGHKLQLLFAIIASLIQTSV